MTREQLEHAIRAACDVADDTEVYVFGSQAILGEHPDAPHALRQSVEADVSPKNRPERVGDIDGALGELSLFHQTHGFYVHGLSLEAAVLPRGWDRRVFEVRNDNTRQKAGLCLETHDLASSKLIAFRDKDREFVRVLLKERLVDINTLITRINALPVPPSDRDRISEWVRRTCEELS